MNIHHLGSLIYKPNKCEYKVSLSLQIVVFEAYCNAYLLLIFWKLLTNQSELKVTQ